LTGLSAFFTTHEWRGKSCHISSLGAQGILTYEPGTITIRIRITSFLGSLILSKILFDVEITTLDVSGVPSAANKYVFIVHGHSEAATLRLKELLSGLGLNPIVLNDQDDRGMTIIEKFEYYARTCSFAFILMTPDDRTAGVGGAESLGRARQNFIMELGWFMAHLGRDRVVILYNGKLEIPSDILGVVYGEFKASVLEAANRIRLALKRVELLETQA
jgi:predicted nucleotide-binding protein